MPKYKNIYTNRDNGWPCIVPDDVVDQIKLEAWHWIPLSKKLPKEGQEVLTALDGRRSLDFFARWDGEDNPPWFDRKENNYHPTHWMPVPDAPGFSENAIEDFMNTEVKQGPLL